MAVTSGTAIGLGIAAGAGAAAAAVRAAKARAQPNKIPYGSAENVTQQRLSNEAASRGLAAATEAYHSQVAQLGPRPAGIKAGMDWDRAKAQLDSSLHQQTQLINKNNTTQDVVKTGYEVATDPLLQMQQQGAQVYGATLAGQGQLLGQAQQMQTDALARGNSAATDQGMYSVGQQAVGNEGAGILAGYRPGAVSQAMASNVVNQAAQASLGAARSGGALGLRNALNANAQAGVGIAGQQAAQAALEQQQYIGQQVQQANLDRQALLDQRNTESAMGLQADEAYRQRVLQSQAQNYGLAANALGAQMGTLDSQASQAVQREQLAASGLDSIRNSQLEAELNYDTRRQQEQQRKSNNLWGLAGSLLGVSGAALGSIGRK